MDMLSSDRLLAWFAQNPAPAFGNHKKVRAMPIGLENRCGTRTFTILYYRVVLGKTHRVFFRDATLQTAISVLRLREKVSRELEKYFRSE